MYHDYVIRGLTDTVIMFPVLLDFTQLLNKITFIKPVNKNQYLCQFYPIRLIC